MFTDWSQTDPHYFYVRGVILGAVFATLFWRVVLPWLRKKLSRST